MRCPLVPFGFDVLVPLLGVYELLATTFAWNKCTVIVLLLFVSQVFKKEVTRRELLATAQTLMGVRHIVVARRYPNFVDHVEVNDPTSFEGAERGCDVLVISFGIFSFPLSEFNEMK